MAIKSDLKPIMKVAEMLKSKLAGILNYLKHRITNASAEGMNSLIQGLKTTARGYRNFENYRISILFHFGKLSLYP
jgi:transposase